MTLWHVMGSFDRFQWLNAEFQFERVLASLPGKRKSELFPFGLLCASQDL